MLIRYLIYTEYLLLLRRSHHWIYPISFFLIVLYFFPLAFDTSPAFLERYMPGAIWITVLLAHLLSLDTLFLAEREDGHLEQQCLSHHSLALIIFIKLTVRWAIITLPLILIVPLLSILFYFNFKTLTILISSLLLGTPLLTFIGGLGATLTIGLKQQGLLLSLLILPLLTPILIFGANIPHQFNANLLNANFNLTAPFALLAGLTLLATLLIPYAIAALLRLGVEDD